MARVTYRNPKLQNSHTHNVPASNMNKNWELVKRERMKGKEKKRVYKIELVRIGV